MRTHFLRQAVRQWEDPTWLTVIHVKYDQSNQFRAVLREHRLIVAVEKHRWRGARWVPAGGALPGGDCRGRRRAVTRAPGSRRLTATNPGPRSHAVLPGVPARPSLPHAVTLGVRLPSPHDAVVFTVSYLGHCGRGGECGEGLPDIYSPWP